MKKWAEMGDRERDMLIAEKIFGQRSMHMGDGLILLLKGELPFGGALPQYTTSMDAAWHLVEHFRERYDVHVGSTPLQYDVAIMDRHVESGHFTANAVSAPEAICLAVLKVVGYKVEE